MTSPRQKVLTWLLSGIAFVIVIAITGCSQLQGVLSRKTAADTPAVVPAPELAGVDAPAPQINVFGEFDGTETIPARSGGEAGFQQHTYVDEGYDGDVAVDAKGQRLVFSSTRHSRHADIYLQKVDGMSVTQLTSDDADDAFPVFSPDGTQIAFCSTRGGNWDIYVMDTEGRNAVQVTNSLMQEIHPSFSPDGRRLVYCAMSNRSGQWELWTVNLHTGEKRMIGFGLFPAWSPDPTRDRIAFQKARARGSRWFSLWTLDLVDGEARRITEIAVSANAAIVSPSWSPDGNRLSFATIVEPAMSDGRRTGGQQDIWTIDADGTNRHRITDGNGSSATPFWGADNRIYFVSDRGGTECIWSAKVGNTPFASVETKETQN